MRPIVTLCALCVCLLDIATSCAKTDEPIDMLLFGMWTRVEPRNHGLDGGPDPSGERTVFGGEVMVNAAFRENSLTTCSWCVDSAVVVVRAAAQPLLVLLPSRQNAG